MWRVERLSHGCWKEKRRHIGGPIAASLPQIYKSVPHKHEFGIKFAR
jgi:hypothetical protein